MYIGLRIDGAPDVKYTAIIPTAATSMATGSRRASGFVGVGAGICGGGSMTIGTSATGGAISRCLRAKSIEEWTSAPTIWFHTQPMKLVRLPFRECG
jgi:hypothetical protein